jgi:rhodanese-related sulfurtransferase
MKAELSKNQNRLVAIVVIIALVFASATYYTYVWLPSVQSRTTTTTTKGYQDVTVEQAYELINNTKGLVILDVRTLDEFNSGHIAGAIFFPVNTIQGNISKLDPQSYILVTCGTGTRSAQASTILANNGFHHVYNMLGGLTAWKAANYPVVSPT